MAAAATSQGITAAFGATTLGKITRFDITDGVIALDETDLGHLRENNPAGIITISGSIDCLGDPSAIKGTVAALSLGGTITVALGNCLCTEIGYGAQVKGTRTTRYTFVSSNG
jgi:hypothetical protein